MDTRATALLITTLATGCAVEDTAPTPCTACALTDANNFRYEADLAVEVAPAKALSDVTVRWPDLGRDLQGHALDPVEDIVQARLVAFRDLAPEDVAAGLASDSVFQSDVTLYVVCAPDGATCTLSDFGIGGSSMDVSAYFEEGAATWLLALSRQGDPGAAAMLFLEPREDGPATVTLTDASSRLDAAVDLRSLTPVVLPAHVPEVTVAWDALETDGLGNPLSLGSIDTVMVARYDHDPAALEARVFDLLTLSADTWTAPVSDHSVDLSTLAGPRPFPGVDGNGTWLLALTCSACTNPAPRFVTVLAAAP